MILIYNWKKTNRNFEKFQYYSFGRFSFLIFGLYYYKFYYKFK